MSVNANDHSMAPASADAEEIRQEGHKITSVYVYEAPVRMWHWINAAAILTLAATGYLIGSPPLTPAGGEASDHFIFGYIRFIHFAAAYIFAIGFVGRIYWAIVGNHHAKQLFILPFLNGRWWKEALYELRWYLFIERQPKKYVGHNPLAQLAMFFFITLGMLFMIVTGFGIYAEGEQRGSLIDTLFGWVMPLVGDSMALHTLHHLGMWWILIFVMIHIYVAIREDIMSRQSIVSTMISGHRTFKDDKPD